jgi:hypothetical protein
MFTVSLLSVPIIEFIVNWISHLSHLMLHSAEIASAQSGNSVQRSDARSATLCGEKPHNVCTYGQPATGVEKYGGLVARDDRKLLASDKLATRRSGFDVWS